LSGWPRSISSRDRRRSGTHQQGVEVVEHSRQLQYAGRRSAKLEGSIVVGIKRCVKLPELHQPRVALMVNGGFDELDSRRIARVEDGDPWLVAELANQVGGRSGIMVTHCLSFIPLAGYLQSSALVTSAGTTFQVPSFKVASSYAHSPRRRLRPRRIDV